MATPISTVDLYNAYLAYFGRPPEPEGLAFYGGQTEAQVLAAFSSSQESRDLLAGTNLADSINNVYLNLFNRNADVAGLNYWIDGIATGAYTLAEAAMSILRGAQGKDLETVNAKNDAMVAFVAALDTTAEIIGYSGMAAAQTGREFIATVGWPWNADGSETTGPISVPSDADIDAAVAAATAPGAVTGETFFLTVGQDGLNGNISNDTFIADVMQNPLGAQVNSLGTGDRLNGGAGTDALEAQVTEGANYGGLGAPVQPRTTSIEVVKMEALNSKIGTTGESVGLDVEGIAKALIGLIGDNLSAEYNNTLKIPGYIPLLAVKPLEVATTEVYVNAKDMTDVQQMWSWYSDANLTVQNMTTLDAAGNMRNIEDMTIGMGYSGNKDSHWNESDYKVYFDQDYLVPGNSFNNEAFYWLLDQDAAMIPGADELDNINVDGFLFKIGDGPMLNLESDAAFEAGTWEGFVAALQAPLQAMKDAGLVPADMTLTLDPTNTDYTFLDDGSQSMPIPAMVLATKENVAVTPLGFSQVEEAIGEFNVYGRFSNDSQVTTDLLTIGVALEKVGLAGPGGELVIGSMDKTECNVWSDDKEGHGIQQFNVTVYGNEAKSSSLAGLHSTNNNLEKVVVKSGVAAGGTEKDYADLTIGNSNTRVPVLSTIDLAHSLGGMGGLPGIMTIVDAQIENEKPENGNGGEDNNDNTGGSGVLDDSDLFELQILNDQADCFDCDDVFSGALKDVQTFDSSAFLGDLTLFASLTSEITPKYLNLQDEQDDPTADNVEFDYITGVGDDYVALTVSAANLAKEGAATREDFELVINSGAGNDQVVLSIVDCDGEDDSVGGICSVDELTGKITQWGFDNWYDNQALNANMRIVTEAGNDTVRTGASGNFIIDTGADKDTVYLQNTGSKATWVYNTITNGPIHTEITNLQSDVNNSYKLYDATLTVQFRHLTATVALANTNGTTTDLQVNQAIKKAINSDPVLSKLIVANDGPANTLVVTALIDGDQADDFGLLGDDLLVSINAPKASDLNSGEVAQLASWWNLPGSTAASLVTFMESQLDVFDAKGDYAQTYATHANLLMSGTDSRGTSDNNVTPGTGNDVVVLGTGRLSNDVVVFNTLGFSDASAASKVVGDVVVNFDSGWNEAGGMWSGGEDEVITLQFSSSDGDPVAQTIIFDGKTVTLAAPQVQGVIPVADVASQFYDQFGTSTNWTVINLNTTTGEVQLQANKPGVVTDVTAANLTGTFFATNPGANGNGTVGVTINTQGQDVAVAGTKSTFTVEFTTAPTASANGANITFDTMSAGLTNGDGALTIANKVAAMDNANWASSGVTKTATGYSVTFLANNVGPTPLPTTEFLVAAGGTDNITGTLTGKLGTDPTTKAPEWILYPAHPDCGYDQLDFTGLGGKGSLFAGSLVSETNGSITVQALSTANDTAAEIAALYASDSTTATKHIFITYDSKDEGYGRVWQVVDAAGTATGGNTTATLAGVIDLADTPWASLHAVNFVG